jgi:hypothetical protein
MTDVTNEQEPPGLSATDELLRELTERAQPYS